MSSPGQQRRTQTQADADADADTSKGKMTESRKVAASCIRGPDMPKSPLERAPSETRNSISIDLITATTIRHRKTGKVRTQLKRTNDILTRGPASEDMGYVMHHGSTASQSSVGQRKQLQPSGLKSSNSVLINEVSGGFL